MATTTSTSTCQYCDHEVQYGTTEHGFAGFVHLVNDRAECPPVQIRHDQGVETGEAMGLQYADPTDLLRVTHIRVRFADRTISTWPITAVVR